MKFSYRSFNPKDKKLLSRNFVSAVSLSLISLSSTDVLAAEPYQFSVGINLFQPKFGSIGESTQHNVNFTYYLLPIAATNEPLGERAFLSKSAYIGVSLGQSNPDSASEADILNLRSRFVTQSNTVFEIAYEKLDIVYSDIQSITFGVGKYLDDNSLVVVSLKSSDEFAEPKTLSGRYRQVIEAAEPSAYIAYGLGLGYTDAANDTSLRIDANGTYYFSKTLSAGVSIVNSGGTDISLYGSMFFTENLVGDLYFTRSIGSNNSPNANIGLGVSYRF